MASPSDSSFEASRRALHELLKDLCDIDLTDDIYDEGPFLEAHGGYSDVFAGKSRKHGATVLAIKRLRVHIMKNKDVFKVRVVNELWNVIVAK